MPLDAKYAPIYLNDHLAGSTMGLSLAKRTLASNRGTQFERVLERIAREIDEDRETLRAIMRALGVGEDQLKKLTPYVAERVGRLKLNGSWLSYSPLSRVVEFEALSAGIQAKLSLWRALAALDGRLSAAFESPLGALIERAEAQLERLEQARLRAVVGTSEPTAPESS
jgi:hypothetical protein